MRAGLFDKPSPANRPLSGKTELIGAEEHRAIARQAVRESLVLLKNNNNVLPIKPNQRVLVAGPAADNIGQQSGGWTISWQGTGNSNEDFPGGTSIYDGIADAVKQAGGETELAVNGEYQEKPDVAVVVYGETPYAEGNGDIDNVDYQRGNAVDLELLKRLKEKGIPVVSVFISGRPMYVNPELNASDAFVAAWLPGSEGAGVADVLVTDAEGQIHFPISGQLPFSWPKTPTQGRLNGDEANYDPLFKLGYGLSFDDNVTLDTLNTDFATGDQPLEMAIFERSPQAPWRLMIGNSAKRIEVTSSIQSLNGVKAETFDDQVQEDARRFMFEGEGANYFSFVSPFPRDLRAYSVEDGVLSVTVKASPDKPLTLSLNCGPDACEFSQNIEAYLNEDSAQQWTTLNFSVQCLEQAGVDTASTGEVLRLGSSADSHVSIRDARLQVTKAINDEVLCLSEDDN